MYKKQVEKINKDLKRTGKAIVALGCSFVQGQGAVNDDLYTDYKWNYVGLGYPLEINVNKSEIAKILKDYPNLTFSAGKFDFTYMEYENAFVNVLCKKYLQEDYTAINLGIRGCGNRATIKELYFHPEINWEDAKEIIVIYSPSELERFDFCNDMWDEHFHWKAMWPHYKNVDDVNRKKLWEGYAKVIWSEKFEVIEQIAHVQELLTWCKLKKAKLIITPGFDNRYTRTYFEKSLKIITERDTDGNLVKNNTPLINFKSDMHLAELFPWENMFAPDGYDTFVDLAMSQELLGNTNFDFFQFLGTGSPNKWITPCSHPSAKAHDLFASKLCNYIKNIK